MQPGTAWLPAAPAADAHTKSQPRKRSDALDKLARLFKIITLAASATDQEHLGRCALADACGCSLSTLNRDLALLAQAGIPIDYDRRRGRYHLPDTGWTFPVAALTPADALALALLHSLAAAPGIPHGDALRRTLDKLAGSVPPALAVLLEEAGAVVGWGISTRDYSQSPLDLLEDAAFLVALEAGAQAHPELLRRCADALQRPVWPLFLGRKACVPTRPIFEALTNTYDHIEDALERHAWSWLGASHAPRRLAGPPIPWTAYVEDPNGPLLRQDALRLNAARLYGFRQVRKLTLTPKNETSD